MLRILHRRCAKRIENKICCNGEEGGLINHSEKNIVKIGYLHFTYPSVNLIKFVRGVLPSPFCTPLFCTYRNICIFFQRETVTMFFLMATFVYVCLSMTDSSDRKFRQIRIVLKIIKVSNVY